MSRLVTTFCLNLHTSTKFQPFSKLRLDGFSSKRRLSCLNLWASYLQSSLRPYSKSRSPQITNKECLDSFVQNFRQRILTPENSDALSLVYSSFVLQQNSPRLFNSSCASTLTLGGLLPSSETKLPHLSSRYNRRCSSAAADVRNAILQACG